MKIRIFLRFAAVISRRDDDGIAGETYDALEVEGEGETLEAARAAALSGVSAFIETLSI